MIFRDISKHDDAIDNNSLEEKVISVRRCTKVVKGGRNFCFSALVAIGDKNGSVGIGIGSAKEVADAVQKGKNIARKNIYKVALSDGTIPHSVNKNFCGSKILMKPAVKGTGIVAGGCIKTIFELAGIKDVLSKLLGSNNPINVAQVTIIALKSLITKKEMLQIRKK